MAKEKRLTEKHYNGEGYYMKCSGLCHFDGHCGNCDELEKIVDRLGEYEDKAEQTVEVVRCKDCTQYNGHRYCRYTELIVLDNDFCSYGEKRGDGNG